MARLRTNSSVLERAWLVRSCPRPSVARAIPEALEGQGFQSDRSYRRPAFVQHVNDKLFTPWLKANGVDGEGTFKIHLVDSDGCPNQFDLAPQYLWIAGQQTKTRIRMDWTLNCPCHGKAKSDPSCGKAKEMVAAEQLLHTADNPTRVDSAEQAAEVMCIFNMNLWGMA